MCVTFIISQNLLHFQGPFRFYRKDYEKFKFQRKPVSNVQLTNLNGEHR